LEINYLYGNKIRNEFVPPKDLKDGELDPDMLFADYLVEWLKIVKSRVKIATYSSYEGMVKNPIEPYFRARKLTLRELEARHIQAFYTEKLRAVKSNTVVVPVCLEHRPIVNVQVLNLVLADAEFTQFLFLGGFPKEPFQFLSGFVVSHVFYLQI